MKKIIFIISIISVLGITSCDKKLDLEPWQSVSTEGVFTKLEDFENGVRGVYAELQDAGGYGAYLFIYPDVAADNLIQCQAGRLTLSQIQNWTYTSDHYIAAGIWTDMYDAMNNANLVIENLENFQTDDINYKNQILGEAYALRALIHFELVKVYGKAYSQASASDLGVVYMLKSQVGSPPRETVLSNYQNIVNDLTTALSLINDNSVGPYRISPAAVNAIFAQVDLEMGNWADAITHATGSLNEVPICPLNLFADVWTDDVTNGAVFYIQVTEQDGMTLGTNFSQTGSSGTRSEYVVDYDLYQMYAANDVRRATYFTTSAFQGSTYNHIAKYMQKTGSNTPDLVDLKVIRAAEVLLTRAEAYYRNGNETNALADLNELRSERYSGFVNGNENGTDLLDAILFERRLELAFEGDRLFTLKRLNQGVMRNGSYGDVADGSGETYKVLNLPAGDDRYQLPIPQPEMNANAEMVQNPGY